MERLPSSGKRIINKIKEKTGNAPDIINKMIKFNDTTIYILFSEALTDNALVNEFILEYFEKVSKKEPNEDLLTYLEMNIPTHKTVRMNNYDDLIYSLLSGFTIIIVDGYDEILAFETKAKLDSGVLETRSETIIKGPKDAFTENYQTSIGMIRKRIKDPKLWINEIIVGKRGKSKIAIVYIDDIVDKKLVQHITQKIKNIDIDMVMDSNYIIDLISENKRNVLPNYISTERPDRVAQFLLDGRIAIITEHTPFVVIVPSFFIEFFHSAEDFYEKTLNASVTRMIRTLAFIITILTPAIYVAITSHNHEAIPENLLISFSAQREGVPFPTIVEALLMITTFEILKETDIRIPSTIGSALTIVGTLVLGDAAVIAGIVSPIMVIVIAITAISGLIVYSFDMVNGIRLWRYVFLIFSAIAGIIGIFIAGLIFLINLTSIKTFGIPYFAPFAPFYPELQGDSITLSDKLKFKKRNLLTAKRNIDRTKEEKMNE